MNEAVVVAPSLTPDGYNSTNFLHRLMQVVAPSLTPDGYNARYTS